MARNRKNQPASIRFGPALKALLLCLLIGGAGVGYVWQKDQIRQLGTHIKQREIRLGQLGRENDKRRNQLEIMRSPASLDARIRELNLGLSLPPASQIWVLDEPAPEAAMPSAPVQYAARTSGVATPQ